MVGLRHVVRVMSVLNAFALVKMFGQDMPSPGSLKEEFAVWQQKWKDVALADLPSAVADTLKQVEKLLYPNIHTASSASCTCTPASYQVRVRTCC